AAVVVPETFLYGDGAIGKTREMIVKGSEEFTVVSLPRGVFNPYTPTKTNIIYFKKGGQFKNIFFFAVLNDGFELNTKRKPLEGDSDIKKFLSEVESPRYIKAQSNIVNRSEIKKSGNWNLRPFFYMEDVPEIERGGGEEMISLSDGIIEHIEYKVDPTSIPDKDWSLLEVSQKGIFLADTVKGSDFTQPYKQVRSGDIAYNPHRVNIGSIGVVPDYLDGGLVSPAYVVVRPTNKNYPASYIVSILKHERYMRVIMNYSLSSVRASLPYEELTRIRIPIIPDDKINRLLSLEKEHIRLVNQAYSKEKEIYSLVPNLL
ncbi:MAG: N-6 DNA methylase, partial [Rhodobacteraceae bacterium]|nr:N-6 DNA methylase [Paracoccaceae bacterium]